MRVRLVAALILSTAILSACNGGAEMRPEGIGDKASMTEDFANQRASLEAVQAGRFDRDAPWGTPGAIAGRGGAGASIPVAATLPAGDATVVTAETTPAAVRSIIYNAALRMTVADTLAMQRVIQQRATAAGGYMQEIDGGAISVRVPAAKFESVLAAIELLGEVTNRHVKANDVTEEMRDLRIRLENAETMRKRITELMTKSEKIEDTIKLEQELQKATETIELIKGKLQYMQDQVAFSTIRVDLNSTRASTAGGLALALPFAWVKELGDGAVAGVTQATPDTSRLFKRNERFSLPAGFVRYYERDGVTEAMSAEELIIKLRRQDNYDGGDIAFWGKLVRRVLVENRAIAIQKETDTRVKDGSPGRLYEGVKDLGARKQGYILGIVATSRYVYTFEAWGDADKLAAQKTALDGAFVSLDVKHW